MENASAEMPQLRPLPAQRQPQTLGDPTEDYLLAMSESLDAGDVTHDRTDDQSRIELARDAFGQYPTVRHYPTLEAIQRLYVMFGYAAVGVVFPYLVISLGWVCYRAEDDLIRQLVNYSEWAVPVVFGTVALVGTLFAASEGIKLAIDVQDNTLRIANAGGRRRR